MTNEYIAQELKRSTRIIDGAIEAATNARRYVLSADQDNIDAAIRALNSGANLLLAVAHKHDGDFDLVSYANGLLAHSTPPLDTFESPS